ncbi:hypothetical protein V6N13_025214 [Hibiscus sabdariffa]
MFILSAYCLTSSEGKWENAKCGWHKRTVGKPEADGRKREHERQTRLAKEGLELRIVLQVRANSDLKPQEDSATERTRKLGFLLNPN